MAVVGLGKPFAPRPVRWVAQRLKTGSVKVLRQCGAGGGCGEDSGDLPGAEDPDAVDETRAAVGQVG